MLFRRFGQWKFFESFCTPKTEATDEQSVIAQLKGVICRLHAQNLEPFHEDVVYRRGYCGAPAAVRGERPVPAAGAPQ